MNAPLVVKHPSSALALPEHEMLAVLQASLYPGAALASIKMVLSYCKAAGLDPMQKPVHIVPLYDSKAKSMRDVVMPGVTLYRIQAARSGQFMGISEPEFGPDVHAEIGGVKITYPEWCRVTVKRLVGGHVAEFTAREFWIENYAPKGGPEKSPAPNAMWSRRTRGQIAKCAEAQALRKAFPEFASAPTAEEMEGKPLNPSDDPVNVPAAVPAELVLAGEAAAAGGWKSLVKWVQSLSEDQRDLLVPESARLKDLAREADAARTVDPVTPPPPPPPAATVDDEFVAAMNRAERTAP